VNAFKVVNGPATRITRTGLIVGWWELPAIKTCGPACPAACRMRGCIGVKEITGEQLGSALRQLAADLATARRRVVELERENRELEQELEQLRRSVAEREVEAALSG
jgi:AMMECR1 domain-containing protein